MVIIKFDNSCLGWTKTQRHNELFLTTQRCFFNDLLRRRGYLYLNCIYETLGAKWNPDDENICYRLENGLIPMEFEQTEDGTVIVKIY